MKSGPTQTSTTSFDANTQQYVDAMRAMAQSYTGGNTYGGPNANTTSAMAGFQNTANAGALGQQAVEGNPSAVSAFMNPYMSQMDPFFSMMRANAVTQANQGATQQGAFGGDRSQIGAATAGANADYTQAQFTNQNFQQSMQNAMQMANLGMGANQNLYQGGQYLFGLPQQWQAQQMGLLQSGGTSPTSQSSYTPTEYSPLMMAGGLAASLFGGGAGTAALSNLGFGGGGGNGTSVMGAPASAGGYPYA